MTFVLIILIVAAALLAGSWVASRARKAEGGAPSAADDRREAE